MEFTYKAIFFIATICGLIYHWCKHKYSYWRRHGVPQDEPTPLIGNIKPFLTLKSSFGIHLSNIYADKKFAKSPVVGIYLLNRPGLVIRDLDLVKSILIKDFNKFSNRYSTADPHRDSLGSNNLFFVKNPHWKEMRTKLTPVFTSGKVKQMYPLMLEIANELEHHLTTYTTVENNGFVEEIKEICARFTTDMIATIAFGLRANSLQNPNAEFRRVCRNMFDFDIFRAKDFFIAFFLPKLVSLLRVQLFTQEFSNYVRNVIHHVMDERERSGTKRNDLIDILLALKKAAIFESKRIELQTIDDDFLVAQGAVFLTAGFETSSSTMAFALYELAKQPELQNRLRNEICKALLVDGGSVSYERINSMEYLGMVVDEVLRLYPVLPFLDREYMKNEGEGDFKLKHFDYKFPDGLPVYLPIFGIQRDAEFWPEPNKFDPERFSQANKKTHHPMAYLPFGTGPHNCIGSRIGLLQTKIGLVHFFKNHFVSTCDKTPKDVVFDPKAFVLQSTGGLYLKVSNDKMFEKLST